MIRSWIRVRTNWKGRIRKNRYGSTIFYFLLRLFNKAIHMVFLISVIFFAPIFRWLHRRKQHIGHYPIFQESPNPVIELEMRLQFNYAFAAKILTLWPKPKLRQVQLIPVTTFLGLWPVGLSVFLPCLAFLHSVSLSLPTESHFSKFKAVYFCIGYWTYRFRSSFHLVPFMLKSICLFLY